MSADLSQPLLQPSAPRKGRWLRFALNSAVALLLAAAMLRLFLGMQARQQRADLVMQTSLPTVQRFLKSLEQKDWPGAASCCSRELQGKLPPESWGPLALNHPELMGPSVALGYSFRMSSGFSFSDFLGAAPESDAEFRYQFRLAPKGDLQGPILSVFVGFQDGRVCVTRLLMNDQDLAQP